MSGRNTSSDTARRLELLRELQRLGAARRHQDLEALVAGEIDQHPRIMRVILDDQKNSVARFEVESVIGNCSMTRSCATACSAGAALY